MRSDHPFANLPKNFQTEKKILVSIGINSWSHLAMLQDEEISQICQRTLSTTRNLKRLRCIAMLICELDISLGDAALLMHSGISSLKALSRLSPEELVKKTGRLERLLKSGRQPVINLEKAHLLIKKAIYKQL